MTILTEQMRAVLKRQPVVYCATADSQGRLDVSPRCVLRILDEDRLVLLDLFATTTRANLSASPRMAAAFADPQTYEGYRLYGSARLVAGGPLYGEMLDLLAQAACGPPPMELWFEKAARGLVSMLARSDQVPICPEIIIVDIDEIQDLVPRYD